MGLEELEVLPFEEVPFNVNNALKALRELVESGDVRDAASCTE